jgi:hypothetical protein
MRLAALAGFVAALAVTPALAVPAQYDIAFVTEFAESCVPQRMSYPGLQQTALAQGWTEVRRTAHPELDAMMGVSEAAMAAPDLEATFEYKVYSKPIEGRDHFLLVSRTSANVGGADEPDFWNIISCYLYDFDAAAPIDPEPVTALIGKPIAQSHSDESMVAYSWGPPCAMPMTLDTYLTWVPDGSEHAKAAGFSGLVLKFETSEPDPGEVVPSTYC